MDGPILLTGATGFVGSYVLQELLAAGHDVVVFARCSTDTTARQRVETSFQQAGNHREALPESLVIVSGNLRDESLAVDAVGLQRLRSCRTIIHAAACVQFEEQPNGDPSATNFDGTRRLLDILESGHLRHWLQVSTAYVAGKQWGPVYEDDESPRRFYNAYESSKWNAEQLLRQTSKETGFRLTIARPAIVVGEYATGRTSSYQGFYRPLRAFALLLRRANRQKAGSNQVSLRLDIEPSGIRNLVPVDWVARQIVALAETHRHESGTYHLTPVEPTRNDEAMEAVRRIWNGTTITFDRSVVAEEKNKWERLFYENLGALGPYWRHDVRFDNSSLRAAFPDDPCPRMDVAAIERLVTFAEANNWGGLKAARPGPGFPCDWYLRQFLVERAPRSALRRISSLTLTVRLQLAGSGGGNWTCCFKDGELQSVTSDAAIPADVTFVGDSVTFGDIVSGRTSAQQAFFDRRFDVSGDVEMGLKMAAIFGEFINEFPCSKPEGIARG